MRLALSFAFLVLLGAGPTAQAATLRSATEARNLTNLVMEKVTTGNSDEGLRLMKPYLTVPDAEFESVVGQVRGQVPALSQRFGKIIGFEFVREDGAGTSLLRIIQLQKFERHAIRWTFIFYRGADGWSLNSFNFDENIRTLFAN